MAITFNFEIDTSSCPATIIFVTDEGGLRTDRIATPLRIEADMWCSLKGRPQNIYLKKFKKVNVRLNNVRVAVTTYFNTLLASNEPYSLRKLTQIICKHSSIDLRVPSGGLLDRIEAYIKSRAHIISASTRKRYHVFYNLLQKFEAYLGQNLFIRDINASIIPRLLAFGEEESYSISTIHRTVYFIRTVLNHLEKRGIRTFVYELEIPKTINKMDMVTLSEEELLRIKDLKVYKQLKNARDWLIISCYTGQRISDFMRFTSDMIKIVQNKKYIVFRQCKTKKEIHLPLHPAVQEVIAEYGNRFPPKISYKLYNIHIKYLSKIAGLEESVNLRKRIGFRSRVMNVPKWKAITTHVGRRSFVSNFYGKIPTPLLMEATGHSSELMFQRYINPLNTQRILLLNQHFEETYKIALGM
ncbi:MULTISPECIES: tyrosine-type recombinase/integrase [Sphingobacterium]|uniref:Tyrosine-type recombinase/integrase n=1 Tax=Sphingobacterium populi TaxID=1812824 RepID=A0ABW5U7L7_9SPHI|nr:tyrosine-type recombinase/integrase [Sphingobacterium sp. CFCC 11742]